MNALQYIAATVEPGTAPQVSIESVCKAAARLGLVLATRSNTSGVQTSTVSLVGEFIGTRSASSVIYDVSLRIYETETHVFTNKLYALGWESQLPIATMSEIQSSVRSIRTAVRRAMALTPRLGADHICSLCRVDSQWHSRIVNDLQSIHNTAVATVEPGDGHNKVVSLFLMIWSDLDADDHAPYDKAEKFSKDVTKLLIKHKLTVKAPDEQDHEFHTAHPDDDFLQYYAGDSRAEVGVSIANRNRLSVFMHDLEKLVRRYRSFGCSRMSAVNVLSEIKSAPGPSAELQVG